MNYQKFSTDFYISYQSLFLKTVLLLFLLLNTFTISAQRKGDKVYTNIDEIVVGKDTPEGYKENHFYFGSSFNYAVDRFSNILSENLNNKRERQRVEQAKQQSVAKLAIIKTQYESYDSYPDTINDGWHSAIASDNLNFCKEVKVLIKDNKVTKFVIDNYIPLNFRALGEIKDAKNVVTLNNFNGEQLNIVKLYFVYDIEEPTIVPEPLQPGYVCFWSDMKGYDDILLDLDNERMERLSVRFESEPGCFENGMVCRILKPGTYSYLARGKGTIHWEDTFEIKENQCLKIRLGRRN
jgi:hypothetical protein